MSFVVVLPVAPVTPTTRAVERSRTSPPIVARAACGCSGTSAAAAPRASACLTKSAPASDAATKRSPSSIRCEAIWTPVTSLAQGCTVSRPSGSISSSASGIIKPWGKPGFPHVPPSSARRAAMCVVIRLALADVRASWRRRGRSPHLRLQPPQAPRSSARDDLLERLACDDPVVERDLPGCELLLGLDRGAPVELGLEPAHRSGGHVGGDRRRLLAPRV